MGVSFAAVVRVGVALASAAILAGCSTASGSGSDRDPSVWSWLGADGGTYWYVPTENLLAYGWPTESPQSLEPLQDQTVWHIESYDNGYFYGSVVAQFVGYSPQCQFLIGSVTPDGRVYITFNGLSTVPDGTPSLTTGFGAMVQADGEWTFNMQMASGSSSFEVTHWAFMDQCTADEPCWNDLPGVDQSIPDFLAACGAD